MRINIGLMFVWQWFLGLNLSAQAPWSNTEKYEWYMLRLRGLDGGGGFVSVGGEAGQSLPASGRHPGRSCTDDWHLNDAQCPRQSGEGLMEWGDCTVYLGHYIAVLALDGAYRLEHRLPASSVWLQLHYALAAIDRLDSVAEPYLGLPSALDGFFMRDDVPPDFCLLPDGSPRFRGETAVYRCLRSDAACGSPRPEGGRFVSQDQVLALLLGLAFVRERLPQDLGYIDPRPFAERAAATAHRLVDYMRRCRWLLKAPDGRRIPGRWGGNARGFSFVFAKVARRIAGQRYRRSYQTPWSSVWGRLGCGLMGPAYGWLSPNNGALLLQAAALSRAWRPRAFDRRSSRSDQAVYALADAVLNRRRLSPAFDMPAFERLLDAAPTQGPCFGTPDCQAPDGWKSFDRWWHPRHQNGNPYGVYFEFSGIDYLFAFALYRAYLSDK